MTIRGHAERQVSKLEDTARLTDPIEIVREYARLQVAEKQLEKDKAALKPKLNMLIPTDVDAKSFTLNANSGYHYVARRVKQDRRKPDDVKLLGLLDAKNAPNEAYTFAPDHAYVATMIKHGQITLAEFAETLKGPQVEYVSLTLTKDGEKD